MPTETTDLRPRLIITADDLGMDLACTEGIVHCMADGLVTSASIMANGNCFDEACRLVRLHGLQRKIGVHIVLDEGRPISERMQALMGTNRPLGVQRTLRPLSARLSAAIDAECRAQLEKVIAAGFQPTHLDSHRHIHTAFPIGRLLVRTAKSYGIQYIRPARNLVRRERFLSGVYKRAFNALLRSRLSTADYFCDIEDFFETRYRVEDLSIVECMVHLGATARGERNLRLLRAPEFQQFLRRFRLVDHSALRASQ